MSPDDFRWVMRRFASGVTVVTTIVEGRPKGFTATAFSSVSLEPPKVLVCVSLEARSHPLIVQAGKFCVNILRLEQETLARAFAAGTGDPFVLTTYHTDVTGAPVIDAVLAYLDCDLADQHTVGTHTIFIGNVRSAMAGDGAPLGYFNANYRDFGCRIP